jgi:anti-sigma factor RsiW
MKRRHEKKIEAHADGATRPTQREQVERWIRDDAARERYLSQTRAMGHDIREAWSEGPPAPSPEYLIAGLRPEMARTDAERARRSAWVRGSERLAELARPAPLAALAGAAALLLVVLTSLEPAQDPTTHLSLSPTPQGLTSEAGEFAARPAVLSEQSFDAPTTIYDLAQGDTPLMIFQAEDGATVLWLLEDEGVSWLGSAAGWA